MAAVIRRILREVVDLWLPPVCAVCRAAECVVCPSCLGSLVSADRLAPPAGLDEVLALLRYDECSRPLVLALKSHGRRDVAEIVAPALARLLDPLRLESAVPTVTWAPTTAGHRRSRGYDQAELLARAIARSAHLPVRRLLRRSSGSTQTGRTRVERLDGVEFSVSGRPPTDVVVCDDVLTTGATMSAAAMALRGAGVARVTGLVLARTP